MPRNLNPETIAIVKATAPVLEKHGVEITIRLYERLFQDSAIKALFDEAAFRSGEQPKRLAMAVLAYARNIDKLENLADAVEHMARRHVEARIQPEHYPAVAEALLPAIREVLGEAATDEVLAAWGEAYWFLAEVLMGAEKALYARAA